MGQLGKEPLGQIWGACLKNTGVLKETSTLWEIFMILPKIDRQKLYLAALAQVGLGLLDLIGVLSIGLLGAISIAGIKSQQPGSSVGQILTLLHLDSKELATQVIALGIGAVAILLIRTVVSIIVTRKVLSFLSHKNANISKALISNLLYNPQIIQESKSTQQLLYQITRGVELLMMQVLATFIVLIGDLALLVVLALGLFVVDPVTAVGTLMLFSIIGYLLNQYMGVRAKALGKLNTNLNVESNEKIIEALMSYRESIVRNRRSYYAGKIGDLRLKLAKSTADLNFLPYVSKYVIETLLIVGTLLLGLIQFIAKDLEHAVSVTAIFLAAGTRIAPSVLRVQQGLVQVRGNIGASQKTLDLISQLGAHNAHSELVPILNTEHVGFVPTVSISNLTFAYKGSPRKALKDINVNFSAGSFNAVVGASGAGKSTLIDVLLGVIKTDEGNVEISGLPPLIAVERWPGAISYVPQEVFLSAGTIADNIALGYPLDESGFDLMSSAAESAQLDELIMEKSLGLNAEVGERGSNLSGGQRQRIGIARALYTKPKLLIFDEATSALDGETEWKISESILRLRHSATVIMIAHRLSSIRNADQIIYMDAGQIKAIGTFEEVRKSIPDFDRQATLMGL